VSALVAAYRPEGGRADVDARQAIVEALGEIATHEKTPADAVASATEVLRAALTDPAPTVRLTARGQAAKIPALAEAAKAEDAHPNEWRGLPRPKAPLLGLDLTQGEPWLTEAEILRLAAAIQRQRPVIVLETTHGRIRMEVDAAGAPVHAVNLLLCAAGGVYDGTPWHRVVPAFVIQGGDPRGDGSGDAGYSLPDEITPTPFERGLLGMPKSTKDTGGCQLFLMHVAAPHLDGNYTAYGRAVSGLEVIDRLRIGDRILKATVEVPGR
jgi:cyclophilin family peptidyl-prolyl cis-trans isomerase